MRRYGERRQTARKYRFRPGVYAILPRDGRLLLAGKTRRCIPRTLLDRRVLPPNRGRHEARIDRMIRRSEEPERPRDHPGFQIDHLARGVFCEPALSLWGDLALGLIEDRSLDISASVCK